MSALKRTFPHDCNTAFNEFSNISNKRRVQSVAKSVELHSSVIYNRQNDGSYRNMMSKEFESSTPLTSATVSGTSSSLDRSPIPITNHQTTTVSGSIRNSSEQIEICFGMVRYHMVYQSWTRSKPNFIACGCQSRSTPASQTFNGTQEC